jgi:hypothetical protein
VETSKLLDAVRHRPEMLGLDRSFGQAMAYIAGFDQAHNGDFLAGFREWLITRVGTGSNWAWQGLVRYIAFPDIKTWELPPGEDRQAKEVFLDLLTEFLAIRGKRDGRLRIYDSYGKWLRAQSWYRPGSDDYLDDDEESTPVNQ